jgi:hypothetical protein
MDEDAGRWMTYDEVAAVRGTTRRAAVMLVRRHKWRRQKDNEGHTRALVPATWAEMAEAKSSDNGSGHSNRYPGRALEVLEGALVALQEAHARELLVLRESHQGEVASLREAVDRARGELDTRVTGLQRELEAARERAEALQRADDARKARGLLARLRAAVRGE